MLMHAILRVIIHNTYNFDIQIFSHIFLYCILNYKINTAVLIVNSRAGLL